MTAGRFETITIDGENYRLSMSTIAMAALQDGWKLDSIDAVQQKMADLKNHAVIADVEMMFWAALQREHPEVTQERARILCDDAGLPAIIKAISGASNRGAIPAAPKSGGAPAKPGKRGR